MEHVIQVELRTDSTHTLTWLDAALKPKPGMVLLCKGDQRPRTVVHAYTRDEEMKAQPHRLEDRPLVNDRTTVRTSHRSRCYSLCGNLLERKKYRECRALTDFAGYLDPTVMVRNSAAGH